MSEGGPKTRPRSRDLFSEGFPGEIAMTKLAATLFTTAIFYFVSASAAFAQVKRVEMKIDGYLCGN